MTKYQADPDREIPARKACYAAPCDGSDHPGWRHAKSWDEVLRHLEGDALVSDRDGDGIVAYDPTRNVVTLVGGGQYSYDIHTVLLEDVELVPPATPEEEDEALASIMESFGNRRLAAPGEPLQ